MAFLTLRLQAVRSKMSGADASAVAPVSGVVNKLES